MTVYQLASQLLKLIHDGNGNLEVCAHIVWAQSGIVDGIRDEINIVAIEEGPGGGPPKVLMLKNMEADELEKQCYPER